MKSLRFKISGNDILKRKTNIINETQYLSLDVKDT